MDASSLSHADRVFLDSTELYRDLFDLGVDVDVIRSWAGDPDVDLLDIMAGLSVLSGFDSDQVRRAVAAGLDGFTFRAAAGHGLTLTDLLEVWQAAPAWGSLLQVLQMRGWGLPVELFAFAHQTRLMTTWMANRDGTRELLDGLSADAACLVLALWLGDDVAADTARSWVGSVDGASWLATAVTLRREGMSTRRAVESAQALDGTERSVRVALPERAFVYQRSWRSASPF